MGRTGRIRYRRSGCKSERLMQFGVGARIWIGNRDGLQRLVEKRREFQYLLGNTALDYALLNCRFRNLLRKPLLAEVTHPQDMEDDLPEFFPPSIYQGTQ